MKKTIDSLGSEATEDSELEAEKEYYYDANNDVCSSTFEKEEKDFKLEIEKEKEHYQRLIDIDSRAEQKKQSSATEEELEKAVKALNDYVLQVNKDLDFVMSMRESAMEGKPMDNEQDDTTSAKRSWRPRESLPDSTKRADAEVNRLKKQFRVRLEQKLITLVDERAKTLNLSRQDYVENLLKRDLDL